MLIPATVIELDKSDAALGQPPRQQAVRGIRPRLFGVRAVQLKNMLRLLGQVHQFRNRGLHAVSHLILGHARIDLRVAILFRQDAIELGNAVQHAPARAGRDSRRVRKIEHRIPTRKELHSLVFGRQKAAAPQA